MAIRTVDSALDERTARMALCALRAGGNTELGDLVKTDGAAAAWAAALQLGEQNRWGRAAHLVDPHSIAAATAECGARFIIPSDDEWPTALNDLDTAAGVTGGAPLGLWVHGPHNLANLNGAVAIVGARAATGYGTHIAAEWAGEIATAGRAVVSGLAFGIDAAAHRGALQARGTTIAVTAAGIDMPYPVANTTLMANIATTGVVVTEQPPGSHPTKQTFLDRQRIIAALTAGTLIAEAAARSAARNTITWAKTLNRATMAVPGPVNSSMSATPNRLIHTGEATLVTTATEVLHHTN